MEKEKNNEVSENETIETTNTPDKVEVKVESNLVTSNIMEIKPIGEDEAPYAEQVETARLALHESFQKTKMISRILSIVVIFAMIGALILVVQKDSVCKIFGYIIAGVILLAMIVFYFVTRKKFPDGSREYVKKITFIMNRDTYGDPKFSDTTIDTTEKFKLADTLKDNIYKDVIDIASRNIVHGKYNNLPFSCGELALYVNGPKKNSKVVCFLGYFASLENSLHFEDRLIVTIKGEGEKPSDLPTQIDDLEMLFEQDNFVIYGKKGADFKKILGSKFLSAIKAIEVKGPFLNLNVVLTAGRTSFYMSYDDSLMILPFEKPFDPTTRNQFSGSLVKVFEAAALLKE